MAGLIMKQKKITIMYDTTATTSSFCREHPKHKQSPGVCSVCLTEKLTHLAAAATTGTALHGGGGGGGGGDGGSNCSSSVSLSSLSSYYSSSISSSCSSPVLNRYRNYSIRHEGIKTRLRNYYVLTKSRSLAFVSRINHGGSSFTEKKKIEKEKKRPSGFWSKLIRSTRKEEEKEHESLERSRSTVRVSL